MVVKKGHPRASKNYILEHIVMMESFIWKYLTVDENIHHINGIKDDNSIENLELRVKPQPAGIKAKDAYIWAQKIIKRYKTDLNKL
jgi:hypothetical protein